MPHYYGMIPPEKLLHLLQSKIQNYIHYVQIPSISEIQTSFLSSTKDNIQAIKSTSYFVFLLCRPIVLTIQLLFLFLYPYFNIVFHYTLRHVWILLCNLMLQLKFGTIEFIKFQRSLSRTSIIMELCFIVLCIGIYFLRRYIKRKRYVERLESWYRAKKRIVVKVNLCYVIYVESII